MHPTQWRRRADPQLNSNQHCTQQQRPAMHSAGCWLRELEWHRAGVSTRAEPWRRADAALTMVRCTLFDRATTDTASADGHAHSALERATRVDRCSQDAKRQSRAHPIHRPPLWAATAPLLSSPAPEHAAAATTTPPIPAGRPARQLTSILPLQERPNLPVPRLPGLSTPQLTRRGWCAGKRSRRTHNRARNPLCPSVSHSWPCLISSRPRQWLRSFGSPTAPSLAGRGPAQIRKPRIVHTVPSASQQTTTLRKLLCAPQATTRANARSEIACTAALDTRPTATCAAAKDGSIGTQEHSHSQQLTMTLRCDRPSTTIAACLLQ